MLTEMDGIENRKQVFIIGATNKPGTFTYSNKVNINRNVPIEIE